MSGVQQKDSGVQAKRQQGEGLYLMGKLLRKPCIATRPQAIAMSVHRDRTTARSKCRGERATAKPFVFRDMRNTRNRGYALHSHACISNGLLSEPPVCFGDRFRLHASRWCSHHPATGSSPHPSVHARVEIDRLTLDK
jgi:hypothetical protein